MAYATVDELFSLLTIETPTQIQVERANRVLDEAAAEIDWELGYTTETPVPSPVPALVVGVNLNRAVEHWRQSSSPFGVLPSAGETEPVVTARNSWYRHALQLASLRQHRGIA